MKTGAHGCTLQPQQSCGSGRFRKSAVWGEGASESSLFQTAMCGLFWQSVWQSQDAPTTRVCSQASIKAQPTQNGCGSSPVHAPRGDDHGEWEFRGPAYCACRRHQTSCESWMRSASWPWRVPVMLHAPERHQPSVPPASAGRQ